MAKTIDFLASDGKDDFAFPPAPTKTKAARTNATASSSKPLKRTRKQAAKTAYAARAAAKDNDDDDAQFIASVMQQANIKAGVEVAKKALSAKNKGKNKVGSGVVTGGGSFQSMGLHPSLLRSLLIRGFNTPTPIQRQAIPAIMSQPPRDVVGMARTGSGKTLAYLIPLINRLNGRHSHTFGIKSLILCPSRELAVQILRVGKEIARGWKADPGEGQDGRGQAIRWAMIVGGESLDEQFSIMSNNPDVVIATPGRMLHLTVEMNLDLKSVEYVVFDEADRLFEMGFAEQLEEMLLRLPPTRQTLLFSATLPKKLVEFAKAGLQANPKLVRLDADSKISTDLRIAFFSVKPSEKEAALLLLLRDVIGVPLGEQAAPDLEEEAQFNEDASNDEGQGQERRSYGNRRSDFKGKAKAGKGKDLAGKCKRGGPAGGALELLSHQTIIFCATKHHVEYLLLLLTTTGYACSHIYSSLDQATRGIQMSRFRRGQTSLLIVTDVAARGIDLPVLEHVVNFDFPPQPRTFVHRVGRTARAGRNGWAWSFCTNAELPYLCDLQLFLARPLVSSHTAVAAVAAGKEVECADALGLHESLVLGTFPREALDLETEFITSSLTNTSSSTAHDFPALRQVAERAQQKYEKSIAKASQESYRRAKEMIKLGSIEQINIRTAAGKEGEVPEWTLAGSPLEEMAVHDVIKRPEVYNLNGAKMAEAARNVLGTSTQAKSDGKTAVKEAEEAAARAALLAKVNAFRPQETVFEIGIRGDTTPLGALMRSRRQTMDVKTKRAEALEARKRAMEGGGGEDDDAVPSKKGKKKAAAAGKGDVDEDVDSVADETVDLEQADEAEILAAFDTGSKKKPQRDVADSESVASAEDSDSGADTAAPPTKRSRTSSKIKSTPSSYRDPNFYLSYEQEGSRSERGYSLNNPRSGGIDSFIQQASAASFDLAGDDATLGTQTQRPNVTRWDSKKKKFIQGTVGADNKKMIRTESGVRLPASFRSGRFEEWKREKRVDIPKTGEVERSGGGNAHDQPMGSVMGLKRFRHTKQTPAKGAAAAPTQVFGKGRPGQAKRQAAKDEVKSARQIQKEREIKQQRREKNARPSKKNGKGRGGGGRGGRGGGRGGRR
ncbi:hypothetical protein [Sporisorium scitamineum]|uniref:RNA helicase n=1 Tax=Sporisorium scitamineum TaxID=49012 RepID=A0A0F7SCN4_9BASI|nr:hypothetical protein [Sporisorium scitamineum]